MPANVFLYYRETEKVTGKNLYNTGDDSNQSVQQFAIVQFDWKPMLKSLFLGAVMVTTKTKGLLHFDRGYSLIS